ncbi:equilibrative nucleoside transporter 1-like isoform X2 [Aphidius gifuensis]|uniref:equilibrative nucleoside transporter 1-like n=1 Tax=Aphidius gifuensis TaxID=684658 RepID=UPI001CDBE5D5|nr:equilibrative nucleoside transporter 1-like [Aphidius gifuensis]XP_044007400.1 equilibrative nucleoside transporter 1-like isoform X2 [Aphidius gifuensis]
MQMSIFKMSSSKGNQYYKSNYMFYLTLTVQLPNLFFNWFDLFFSTGGKIGKRIVWGLVVEAVIFLFTIGMAMDDTKNQTTLFFWITMGSVFLLNTTNGIYQNSVYGMAAKLPGKYTGAITLGSSAFIVAVLNIWIRQCVSHIVNVITKVRQDGKASDGDFMTSIFQQLAIPAFKLARINFLHLLMYIHCHV